MPIIHRIESDMFVFADVCDYMINPVNLVGVTGAGLALEFKTRVPSFVEPYKEACKTKELRIGTVQVIEDTGMHWGIINFPTKRHFVDTSSKEDITRGLVALRELLLQDKYRYATIGLPMLGCGCGKQDYEIIYPLVMEQLSDVEACVFLSMSPERTEMRPKHLVVAGPPSFGLSDVDKESVDATIAKVMAAWGTDLSEYGAIVSGGYNGVESYLCGETYLTDVEQTYVYKKTGQTPLVVKANFSRNGVSANLLHNNLLCEIADDIILFKPPGHNNNRLSAMQVWINHDREKRAKDGHPPRRVAVFGEHAIKNVQTPILIPVNTRDGDE